MEKIVFILPAAGQRPEQAHYREVGSYFDEKGIAPVFVNINWRMRQSIEDCAEEAEKQIHEVHSQYPNAALYFFGFSLGANIAFMLSGHYEAKAQVLCSMLPFFKEDAELLPWHYRLSANFMVYPGADRPKYPNPYQYALMDTYFLIGEKEEKFLTGPISENRKARYTESQTIVIPHTKHDLKLSTYQEAVKKVIEELL